MASPLRSVVLVPAAAIVGSVIGLGLSRLGCAGLALTVPIGLIVGWELARWADGSEEAR